MRTTVILVAALAFVATAGAQRRAAPESFPERSWAVCSGETTSADREREAALTRVLAAGDTTGMMVIGGGCVRYSYGDVREVSYIASVRKSVVAMLYGIAVDRGTIELTSTLRSLAVNDKGGLLPRELDATVGDLLAARSGVYHPAANLGDASKLAPARGSKTRGSYFLYNNWDFNALEAILQRFTHRTLYEWIGTELATPLQFEDWDFRADAYAGAVRNDTGASDFPAHHQLYSTRDMARLGYLMLRAGRWGDQQIIPSAWVRRISSVITPADEVARTSPFVPGLAYGNLWWVMSAPPFQGTVLEGAYSATGAYGQFITVVPRLDMVIAHKTSDTPRRNVTPGLYFGSILPAAAALLASDGSGSGRAAPSPRLAEPPDVQAGRPAELRATAIPAGL